MINRLFIISDNFQSFTSSVSADNTVFFSIPADPLQKENLEKIYCYFSAAKKDNLSLLLEVKKPLSSEILLSIVSFLFIPSYLRIEESFVIYLTGQSETLLSQTEESLSACALQQGFDNFIINAFVPSEVACSQKKNWYFNSPEKLIQHYETILAGDDFYNNNIFLSHSSLQDTDSISSALQTLEKKFETNNPKLFLLASDNITLRSQTSFLQKKYQVTENEMNNQKEYADILRSTHSTWQLQDFYNKEYEILPGWYKRLGHLLKVIMGKRTFKSLFNDKVKKYKD